MMKWLTLEQVAETMSCEVAVLESLIDRSNFASTEEQFQQRGIFFDATRFQTPNQPFCYLLDRSNPFEQTEINVLIQLQPQHAQTRTVLIAVSSHGDFPVADQHSIAHNLSIEQITQQLTPLLQQALEAFDQQIPDRALRRSMSQKQTVTTTSQPGKRTAVSSKPTNATQISLI